MRRSPRSAMRNLVVLTVVALLAVALLSASR